MPRIQSVVLPILRSDPRLAGVTINTWIPDVDHRVFPLINIRRIGGVRNEDAPTVYSLPIIEMTAFTDTDLIECEELYETALDVLYDAVQTQKQTPAGYLQSIEETMGATQFSSPFQDSWRVQGLIRLGLRKPRATL
ncbi:tail terminator [Mycobacterium phage Phlei]|uniref:Tail terminator n=1 Tax=Mycobacterium phage Phlei TaxID=1690684 RepID=A0A0N9BDM4_9CAUD|nr:tail terminator [Mycobacterium phage Phlei]ALA48130.1 hypothetical protein [Mycobacterium phage Phlei]